MAELQIEVSGEFAPRFSPEMVAQLRAAFLRWREAGKPDYVPAKEET